MKARTTLVLGLAALGLLIQWALFRPSLHIVNPRWAEAQEATDQRERISLAPAERAAILTEMRVMLQSVSRIVHGLVAGDLSMVAGAARASGARAAVDPQIEKKLPPSFLQADARVHRRFDQLADTIKTGATKEDVLKRLAALTGYCVACHAAYRLEETR